MPNTNNSLIYTLTHGWIVAKPDGNNWRTTPGHFLIYGQQVLREALLPDDARTELEDAA